MTILKRSRSPCKPVAVFASAEVNKYQRYANFGIDVEVVPESKQNDFFGDRSKRVGKGGGFKSADPDARPNSQIAKYQPTPKGGHGIKTGVFRGGSIRNQILLAAGTGVALGAVGAGAMFIRRRRTKKGKIVVENVRRKA